VIVVCEADARFLREEFGVPGALLRVIPNGVEGYTVLPPKQIARERLGLPAGPTTIVGYAGALEAKKGVLDLVEAAALLEGDGVALAIAGEGSLRAELLARARRLAVPLRLLGPVESMEEFYAAVDIFALPSHQEAMPLALLEAMSAGLPIVAARVGGIPEAVRDGVNGLLVEPSSPRDLAAALLRLAGDQGQARRMGEASRAAWPPFSADRMLRQVERLYEEVAGGPARARREMSGRAADPGAGW
jgi:glycosyltransferase involved in cell wall biosynthesis